jgi:hypothetical protein
MMSKHTFWICGTVLMAALSIAACGDDDDNGPSGPANPAGVGNYCKSDADCKQVRATWGQAADTAQRPVLTKAARVSVRSIPFASRSKAALAAAC